MSWIKNIFRSSVTKVTHSCLTEQTFNEEKHQSLSVMDSLGKILKSVSIALLITASSAGSLWIAASTVSLF